MGIWRLEIETKKYNGINFESYAIMDGEEKITSVSCLAPASELIYHHNHELYGESE